MSPVLHITCIVFSACVLSVFSTELVRREGLSGDVLVAVGPNSLSRIGHANISAEEPLREHLANAGEKTHVPEHKAEAAADDVESQLESDVGEKTTKAEASADVTSLSTVSDPTMPDFTSKHKLDSADTVPIVQHPSPSAAKIHVVAITNKPKDTRVSILKQSLLTGGFSSNVNTGDFSSAPPTGWFSTPVYMNWTQRLEIQQKMVQEVADEDPEAVFLFVDAFDVLNFGSPEEILAKFHKAKRDVLFSCVTYPYPHQCNGFDWAGAAESKCDKVSNWGAECPHWCRFACAGAFIGKAGVLAQIFAENPLTTESDDQCYFNMVMSLRRYNIALDHHHEVFFSTTDLLQCSLERKGGRLRVISTGSMPSVIHFDATHPTAEHLESFWLDTLQGRDGPLCVSKSSCTDWCWDWDFGDMRQRLTPSDEQLFTRTLDWNFHPHTSKALVALYVVGFVLLLAFVAAAIIHVRAPALSSKILSYAGRHSTPEEHSQSRW